MTFLAEVTCLRYGPGWGFWPIIPLLFWGLFALTAVFWLRRRAPSRQGGASGEGVLAERYARGELSDEEYRARLAVLREPVR